MQLPEAEGLCKVPGTLSILDLPSSGPIPAPGPGRGLSLYSQNNLFPYVCHHTALQKSAYLIVESMKAQLC